MLCERKLRVYVYVRERRKRLICSVCEREQNESEMLFVLM
jgi:hypothetical protein